MAKTKQLKEKEREIKLADLGVAELEQKARQIFADLAKKRLEKSVSRLKNTREIFNLRKLLARVKTQINIKMKLNSVKL